MFTLPRKYVQMLLSIHTQYLQSGVCCDWPWPSHAEPQADQSEPGSPVKPAGPAVEVADCEGIERRKIMSALC